MNENMHFLTRTTHHHPPPFPEGFELKEKDHSLKK